VGGWAGGWGRRQQSPLVASVETKTASGRRVRRLRVVRPRFLVVTGTTTTAASTASPSILPEPVLGVSAPYKEEKGLQHSGLNQSRVENQPRKIKLSTQKKIQSFKYLKCYAASLNLTYTLFCFLFH